MLPSLLRTKLYMPPRRSQLVLRPHLTEQLNQGLARKLTLISAPAGFGKTIALSKWIANSPQRVAWLSLDEGDNDPVRFWSYIIAALQTLNSNLGLHTIALLQSPQPIPIESVLTLLVNEIDSFPEEFALALEDYHAIDRLEIHQAMTFLLEHLPARMHLYITSRSDPPLPLVQLRARDELIEITGSRFAFYNR